jgi:hypothetical protein
MGKIHQKILTCCKYDDAVLQHPFLLLNFIPITITKNNKTINQLFCLCRNDFFAQFIGIYVSRRFYLRVIELK